MTFRIYQVGTNTAATTLGGVYVDSIEDCYIVGVSWTSAVLWQAAGGMMWYWLAFDTANTYLTSQIYNHVSNFCISGSFTAAGTNQAALAFQDVGLYIPWKLGQRLYINTNLAGTGPATVGTNALIQTKS